MPIYKIDSVRDVSQRRDNVSGLQSDRILCYSTTLSSGITVTMVKKTDIRDHLSVSAEKPCPLTHSPFAAGHFGNGPFFRVPRSQSNSCYFSWWFSQLLRGPSQASMTSSPPSRACGLPSFAVLRRQRRRYF